MAWVAVENFNSYSDGNLSGSNGGTGWSGAWANQAAIAINVAGTTVYEGAKAVTCSSNAGNEFYTRDLATAISTDGNIVYFAMRRSLNNAGMINVSLRNSSTGARVSVDMNSAGNLRLNGTTSVTMLAGYSANTWYVIRLTFNVVANTATAAYNTGSGWSSESSSVTMSNSGNIDRVGLGRDANAGADYWDLITATDPTAPVSYTLTADQGTFTLTGQNSILRLGKAMIAAVGSFVLSGFSAVMTKTGWVFVEKSSNQWTPPNKSSNTWTSLNKS